MLRFICIKFCLSRKVAALFSGKLGPIFKMAKSAKVASDSTSLHPCAAVCFGASYAYGLHQFVMPKTVLSELTIIFLNFDFLAVVVKYRCQSFYLMFKNFQV